MIFITLWAFIALVGLLIYCAVTDFSQMKIPNSIIVMMIGTFFVAYAGAPQIFLPLWQHIFSMLLVFLITYFIFAKNWMGGGDAKMMTAVCLWCGLKGLLSFIFFMGIAGWFLCLLALWLQKKKPFKNPKEGGWIATVQSGKNAVPYGIAIAIGAICSLSYSGFPHHILDEINKIIT